MCGPGAALNPRVMDTVHDVLIADKAQWGSDCEDDSYTNVMLRRAHKRTLHSHHCDDSSATAAVVPTPGPTEPQLQPCAPSTISKPSLQACSTVAHAPVQPGTAPACSGPAACSTQTAMHKKAGPEGWENSLLPYFLQPARYLHPGPVTAASAASAASAVPGMPSRNPTDTRTMATRHEPPSRTSAAQGPTIPVATPGDRGWLNSYNLHDLTITPLQSLPDGASGTLDVVLVEGPSVGCTPPHRALCVRKSFNRGIQPYKDGETEVQTFVKLLNVPMVAQMLRCDMVLDPRTHRVVHQVLMCWYRKGDLGDFLACVGDVYGQAPWSKQDLRMMLEETGNTSAAPQSAPRCNRQSTSGPLELGRYRQDILFKGMMPSCFAATFNRLSSLGPSSSSESSPTNSFLASFDASIGIDGTPWKSTDSDNIPSSLMDSASSLFPSPCKLAASKQASLHQDHIDPETFFGAASSQGVTPESQRPEQRTPASVAQALARTRVPPDELRPAVSLGALPGSASESDFGGLMGDSLKAAIRQRRLSMKEMGGGRQGTDQQHRRMLRELIMPEECARFFFACIVLGVAEMHKRGLAHMDLKNWNFLMDSSWYLCVADMAYVIDDAHFTPVNRYACGTKGFMAPEVCSPQLAMRGYSGMSADVWSLGACLYEMLTMKLPNTSVDEQLGQSSARGFNPPTCVSEELRDLMVRLCATDPAARPTLPEVMSHPWFKAFDWQALAQRRLCAPMLELHAHREQRCRMANAESKPLAAQDNAKPRSP